MFWLLSTNTESAVFDRNVARQQIPLLVRVRYDTRKVMDRILFFSQSS